jgi:hypothetical protein
MWIFEIINTYESYKARTNSIYESNFIKVYRSSYDLKELSTSGKMKVYLWYFNLRLI